LINPRRGAHFWEVGLLSSAFQFRAAHILMFETYRNQQHQGVKRQAARAWHAPSRDAIIHIPRPVQREAKYPLSIPGTIVEFRDKIRILPSPAIVSSADASLRLPVASRRFPVLGRAPAQCGQTVGLSAGFLVGPGKCTITQGSLGDILEALLEIMG
ncbi:hypothetical protein BaRGS_00004158, partial [Batillaria attramentaria]